MTTQRTPPDVARLWRRVSSTHRMADLLDGDGDDDGDAVESARSRGENGTHEEAASAPAADDAVRWGQAVGGLSLVVTAAALPIAVVALAYSGRDWQRKPAATAEAMLGAHSGAYYALLVPLSVPTAIIFVFVNWFFLKSFKHA